MKRLSIAAALAALLCAASVQAAPGAPDYNSVDWRLVRTFDPIPGPQRGNDFWVMEQDLAAAAGAKGKTRTARVLVRADQGGVWRVVTKRYVCDAGQVEAPKTEVFRPGAKPAREPAQPRRHIYPHGPDGVIYGLVCGDTKTDAPVVHGVDAAFAFEDQADAEFAAARAAG